MNESHIRERVDHIAEDVREIKQRLGIMEEQYANLSRRVDRIDERLERVGTPPGTYPSRVKRHCRSV